MFTRFLRRVAFAALSVFAVLSVFAALPVSAASADDSFGEKVTLTLVFDRALPNVPGKSMKGVLVEYQPGQYPQAINEIYAATKWVAEHGEEIDVDGKNLAS